MKKAIDELMGWLWAFADLLKLGIVLGIFIYFVPYRNIKIVQNKLDKVIELLEKKNN